MTDGLLHVAGAFSKDECRLILDLFASQLTAQPEVRRIPNLPHMPDDYSVARVSYVDDGVLMASGAFDWVYDRVLLSMPRDLDPDVFSAGLPHSALEMRSSVEFNLMHSFSRVHNHFGWHVDTKPSDGKFRSYNINVMLSPQNTYSGGVLQVGDQNVSAHEGDLYLYPASTPHTVHPLSIGVRHSLVIALNNPPTTHAYWHAYWRAAESRFVSLAKGELRDEPKLHLLHGEFLEAQGRGAEAKQAYCQSYRAKAVDRPAYAQQFMQDGFDSLSAADRPQLQRFETAISYLEMSTCIVSNDEVEEGLEALRAARAKALEERHDEL